MKIADSNLCMTSQHQLVRREEETEQLRFWIGEDPAAVSSPPNLDQLPSARDGKTDTAMDFVRISPQALHQSTTDTEEAIDLELKNAIYLLEILTGRKIHIRSAKEILKCQRCLGEEEQSLQEALRRRQELSWGGEYTHLEKHVEEETTKFSTGGKVIVADGREIDMDLEVSMHRQFVQESTERHRLGQAKKDPLVINLNRAAAELNQEKFAFDLDSDGNQEQIPSVASGSGLLAIDRNTNDRIDNGTELFGARSGDGFAELAEYDGDKNQWIDEQDAVYKDLRVWTRETDNSDSLLTLEQVGVGAIYLGREATPFSLRTPQNHELGEIRSTGLYLTEDGKAGTVQQLDLVV
jgi:hypothetical protein